MKPDIHPVMYKDAKVTCTACGAVFKIPGTVKDVQIEICSQCHPVYTGKFRAVLSSGRVDRFQKKLAAAEKAKKAERKPSKRKLSGDEKLRKKLEEAKAEKEEKKKAVAAKERERAKRAAERSVVKKGEKKK